MDVSVPEDKVFAHLWLFDIGEGIRLISGRVQAGIAYPSLKNVFETGNWDYNHVRLRRFKYSISLGLLLATLSFATTALCSPPQKSFHHLTIRDGLSQSTVRAIQQDQFRYLWFGTSDGLNRFDGNTFTVYRHDPEDPYSLPDNYIHVVYEDREGTLWIGTHNGGISKFDHSSDRFRSFRGDGVTPFVLSDNTVRDLFEDSHGVFWIATGYGLNKMDKMDESFDHYLSDPEDDTTLSSNMIFQLYEDSRGTLWVGTSDGFSRYNREEGTFTRFLSSGNREEGVGVGNVRAFVEDRMGRFWVGTERDGLFLFDRDLETFTNFTHDPGDPYSISGNAVFTLLEDDNGFLWIGTGNHGLNLYDPVSDRFFRYRQNSDDARSINNDAIHKLYMSREGIIWIGTFLGGVNVYEPRREIFENYANEALNQASISNNAVQALYSDRQGSVWIGTDGGGLNRFDIESGRIERWNRGSGRTIPEVADVILDIEITDAGIWLGTYNDGIELLDPENGAVRNFRNAPAGEGPATNDIFSITATEDGILWFSTNGGGLSYYDPSSGLFEHIGLMSEDNPESGLLSESVRYVYEDQEGYLWIATYAGTVTRLDRESGQLRHYSVNEHSRFFASVVQHMIEDSRGRLLMASRGGGLLLYNRDLDRIEPLLTALNGLPGNLLHALAEDDSGNIWISSNDGLIQVHPDDHTLTVYSDRQGLSNSEFLPASFTKDQNGFFYFGGVSGFNRFHPDSARVDSIVSTPILTDLYLFNRIVTPATEESPLQSPLRFTDRLTLPYSASVITIGFGSLNYSFSRVDDFLYRLEGLEEEWNQVGSLNRATYTNLRPGEYLFRVRTANPFGIVSEEEATLRILILPPFWRTWWFLSLSLLTLVVASGTLYSVRVQSIQARNILLEKRIREKTEALELSNHAKSKLFSIIAHDLRNYAANFQGLSELIEMESEDDDEMKELSGNLTSISRQFNDFLKNLLDWARSQTETIQYKPRFFDLVGVIKQVISQAAPVAGSKNINLKSTLPDELTVYGDSDMVAIILHNLITNAVKFSHSGSNVEIVARMAEENVHIAVRDQGVGMDRKSVNRLLKTDDFKTTRGTTGEKGSGLGFSICKDFVQRNGGTIIVESAPDRGTTIQFTLPLSPDSTSSDS